MRPDELQAAIDRVEGKCWEPEAEQPEMKQSPKVLSIVPRAAELHRRPVAQGFGGHRARSASGTMALLA